MMCCRPPRGGITLVPMENIRSIQLADVVIQTCPCYYTATVQYLDGVHTTTTVKGSVFEPKMRILMEISKVGIDTEAYKQMCDEHSAGAFFNENNYEGPKRRRTPITVGTVTFTFPKKKKWFFLTK